MYMRQCREVSRLTSRLLVETTTFDVMVRLLRAAQAVPSKKMVMLRPDLLLPQGARFRPRGSISLAALRIVLRATGHAKIVLVLA